MISLRTPDPLSAFREGLGTRLLGVYPEPSRVLLVNASRGWFNLRLRVPFFFFFLFFFFFFVYKSLCNKCIGYTIASES